METRGSRAFKAKFAGPCRNPSCDGVREDDWVHFPAGSDFVEHIPGKCRFTDPLALKREVCSSCFMELLPSGACPNGCEG